MENSTIHLGITAAHGYRGSVGQAQLSRPTASPLAGPCHWALPSVWSPRAATAIAGTMASTPMAQ
jgi:hypothetical protein